MRISPNVRLALRPQWWAWHVALVAVLVAFGWLGWWQLDSFEDAAPARPAGSDAPSVAALDEVTEPGGRLDAVDVGRRVRVTGAWEADGQLLVPDRERSGRLGTLVVTPLRTSAGVVPVVRGWLPTGAVASRPPSGTATVTGVLQRSETEADASAVTGTLPAGQVPYVATVTLLSALPYDGDELYDGYVVLRSQQPVDRSTERLRLVAPVETAAPGGGVGRWRNLAYGLQWWVFAGAAVVFWASVLRRSGREEHPPRPPSPAGADGPPPPLVAPRRTT